jgi:sugar transferase (PEP-CTERM system associated)
MVNLFRHYVPVHTVLQLLLEGMLFFCAVVLALKLNGHGYTVSGLSVIAPAVIFAVLMVCVNSALGLYRREQAHDFVSLFTRAVAALFVGFISCYFVFELFPYGNVFRDGLWVTVVYALAGLLLSRKALALPLSRALFPHRILVLGTGPEAVMVERSLQATQQPNLTLVGFYPAQSEPARMVTGQRVVPSEWTIETAVDRLDIDEVIVAVREQRGGGLPLEALLQCRISGVRVTDLAGFYERVRGEVPVESLKASWLIYGDGFKQDWSRNLVKRVFDLVVSMALLIVALPLMLLTALAIRFESQGPVIYRQERVGQGGRVFTVLKFRSMAQDAEKDGKPRWAQTDDPRVTRIGRFIRKTRIDELPQLLNVLRGDMSFVGPRPERPNFVEELSKSIPYYGVRHSVKPGVTGWAQVRLAYGASVEDAVRKLENDLYYVKNHSLFLDLLILLETVRVVLFREGAR